MKIGALSAAWSDQPLEEVLAFFAEAGLQTIELGAGGWPGDAHCNPAKLNTQKKAMVELEKRSGKEIFVRADHRLAYEDIEVRSMIAMPDELDHRRA